MFKFVSGLTAGLLLGALIATTFAGPLAEVGEWLAWASLVTLL